MAEIRGGQYRYVVHFGDGSVVVHWHATPLDVGSSFFESRVGYVVLRVEPARGSRGLEHVWAAPAKA